MNIHELIKSAIGHEVEDLMLELSRDNSKDYIKSGEWSGELSNPGIVGQSDSRIQYKISNSGVETSHEVYGNNDEWFLDAEYDIEGPFSTPEEALSKLGK